MGQLNQLQEVCNNPLFIGVIFGTFCIGVVMLGRVEGNNPLFIGVIFGTNMSFLTKSPLNSRNNPLFIGVIFGTDSTPELPGRDNCVTIPFSSGSSLGPGLSVLHTLAV